MEKQGHTDEKAPLQAQPPKVVYAQPVYVQPTGVPPKDYLVLSVITILFCFWPLGIIALIKSIESRNAFQRGDIDGARHAGEAAYRFNRIGIIIGIVILVLTFFLIIVCQLGWIIPLAVASNYDS